MAPRIAALDEALTMMEYGVAEGARLPVRDFRPIRETIDSLLEILVGPLFVTPCEEVPPVPSLKDLREAGIPTVSDEEFREAVGAMSDRRCRLVSYVRDDTWQWDEVHRDPGGATR